MLEEQSSFIHIHCYTEQNKESKYFSNLNVKQDVFMYSGVIEHWFAAQIVELWYTLV